MFAGDKDGRLILSFDMVNEVFLGIREPDGTQESVKKKRVVEAVNLHFMKIPLLGFYMITRRGLRRDAIAYGCYCFRRSAGQKK